MAGAVVVPDPISSSRRLRAPVRRTGGASCVRRPWSCRSPRASRRTRSRKPAPKDDRPVRLPRSPRSSGRRSRSRPPLFAARALVADPHGSAARAVRARRARGPGRRGAPRRPRGALRRGRGAGRGPARLLLPPDARRKALPRAAPRRAGPRVDTFETLRRLREKGVELPREIAFGELLSAADLVKFGKGRGTREGAPRPPSPARGCSTTTSSRGWRRPPVDASQKERAS